MKNIGRLKTLGLLRSFVFALLAYICAFGKHVSSIITIDFMRKTRLLMCIAAAALTLTVCSNDEGVIFMTEIYLHHKGANDASYTPRVGYDDTPRVTYHDTPRVGY